MSFLPFSLTLSFEITVQAPNQAKASPPRPASSASCALSARTVSSDASVVFLSPAARMIQEQVRAEMTAKRELASDAESLQHLQTISAVRERDHRLREHVTDAESLEILLRATVRLQGETANGDSCGKSRSRCSSWSSFEEVAVYTPCPSPKVPPSSGREIIRRLDERSPQDRVGQRLREERERPEPSKMLQSSSQAPFEGRQSVAELMSYYESLEARESADAIYE